jgi:excisionase family DNA binding protein
MRLSEAADALGVHYQTAYAWVRQQQLPARKIGRGYEISADDLRAFAARREAGQPPARNVRVRDWPRLADRLHAALVAGDEVTARASLGRLAGAVPLADLCDNVIAPALVRIGEQWAAGEVSIAMEHRASAICERLVAGRAVQPRGRPRGTAVVATPADERHGLPALMAAACLREDCWTVHHLSADLPADDIARFAAEVGAVLVVLSTATPQARVRARQAAGLITAAEAGVAVLVGQPGDRLHDLLDRARKVGR